MSGPLDGIYAKLDRAREHQQEVSLVVERLTSTQQFSLEPAAATGLHELQS